MEIADITFVHIGAGTFALLSGATALIARKGSRIHRASGNLFFVSMLIMSSVGAYMAYLIPVMLSVIAGMLTFYLVATAWMTVMRKEGETGIVERGALIVALSVGASAIWFGIEGANSATGLKDGFPAAVYYIFGGVALLAASLDISVLFRGGISGKQRIARHLWRMCAALYIATSSLFIGQARIFPEALQGTPILSAPVFAVILLMIFWLVRVLFTGWYKKAQD